MQIFSEFFDGRAIYRNLSPFVRQIVHHRIYTFGVCKGKSAQKHESKYSAVHLKRRCRNCSHGCIKRGRDWRHPSLNAADICNNTIFLFQCNLFFNNQDMCWNWDAWLLHQRIDHFFAFSGFFLPRGKVVRSCAYLMVVTFSGAGNKPHRLNFLGNFHSCYTLKYLEIMIPYKLGFHYICSIP